MDRAVARIPLNFFLHVLLRSHCVMNCKEFEELVTITLLVFLSLELIDVLLL
jgi:hypothetical protein